MRAVVARGFADPDLAGIEEVPDPTPGAGDVLIEVQRVPVNFVDKVIFAGKYQFMPTLPYVPGKGPVGVVRAVGDNVTQFGPGDRVLAMAEYGGFAELAVADHRQVYQLPDELPVGHAAAMSLAYDTAWMALRDRARIQEGDSVLVLGSSGAVGQAAVALATAMGASLVLPASRRDPNRGNTASDGLPEPAVDLSAPNLRDSIRQRVLELTDGRGVDVVIDMVGGPAFDGAIRSVAWRGRYVVVGFASGTIATLKTNYPLLKNIEVSGVQISDYRKKLPDLVAAGYAEIFEMCRSGLLPAPAYDEVPFEEWKSVFFADEAGFGGRRQLLAISS